MGQVKDAIVLASASLQVDRTEPKTNFLLGLAYLLDGNYSSAAKHFQLSIGNAEASWVKEVEHYRLIAACQAAEREAAQQLQCSQGELVTDTTFRTVLRCKSAEEQRGIEAESGVGVDSNCEAEVQGHTNNPASLEVAAIADTDDDYLTSGSPVNEEKFINFGLCIYFILFFSH